MLNKTFKQFFEGCGMYHSDEETDPLSYIQANKEMYEDRIEVLNSSLDGGWGGPAEENKEFVHHVAGLLQEIIEMLDTGIEPDEVASAQEMIDDAEKEWSKVKHMIDLDEVGYDWSE